ncbi:hypothetical protein [Paludisphaera soli]|uniref:hypothetical protein n=1 Tax=Paludisphaera soli TaxID=2712865 RepID=UPI0013EAD5A5|nr:hypothetical protein [Paludisphaera soli]
MSERLNLYGFSIARMRRLFRSGDVEAVARIRERMATEQPDLSQRELGEVCEIVERAVTTGVPFGDLECEGHAHWLAANALAGHDQEWLVTSASAYHASALRDSLGRRYGKYARPEVRALLRGFAEGVPLFGRSLPEDGLLYAAVGGEKLRAFGPGLVDLREQVDYRVGRKREPTGEDLEAAEFVGELCGWIAQIQEAGLDLWYCTA